MFFTDSVNDITEDDLLQLSGHQSEDETWEFKSQWPKDNFPIQKAVCAFANSGGGYLIIGLKYDGAGLVEDVPGVASFAQHNERVVSSCGAIAPRVVPQVREVPLLNGNVVPVVYTAPSPDVPHMAGDKKYYLRAGRQSAPMPESMVARLYEVRRTREQRIEAYLQEAQFGVRPFDREAALWVSAFVIPLRLDDTVMEPTGELLEFIHTVGLKLRLFRPAMNAVNSYRGFTADISTPGRTEFFLELRRTGFLTAGRTFPSRQSDSGVGLVSWALVAEFLTEFLGAAHTIYAKLGYSYFVRLGLVLDNIGQSMLADFLDTPPTHRPEPNLTTLIFHEDILASHIHEEMVPVAGRFMARLGQSYGLAVYDVATDWSECHKAIVNTASSVSADLP